MRNIFRFYFSLIFFVKNYIFRMGVKKVFLIFLIFSISTGCTLKASILLDELSNLPSDENENENISDVFPKDKITPIFQDNFNRPDQDILLDPRWMSGIGSSVFIESEHLATSGNSGNIVISPNNPSAFPDTSKSYIENSIVMEGTADHLYAILPVVDISTTTILGCFYSYTAATKTLNIYAGSYMDYVTSALIPLFTLTNYPVQSVNYLGCELDSAAGTAKAYFNLIEVGSVTGLPVVDPADSIPVLLGQSANSEMIVDNVKAFPSFLEGRTPNGDSKIKIYNPPFQKHMYGQLANFSLQGYCSDNGATIQVKDSPPGSYQSGTVVCSGNIFSIPLDLTNLTRFPLGPNQIRIEYVVGGVTSEYFWNFTSQPTPPVGPTLVGPNPTLGNANTEFVWTVTYQAGAIVNLTPSLVYISGSSTGCTKSISAIDSLNYEVKLVGCSANSGFLGITILAGSAKDAFNNNLPASAASTDAEIDNERPIVTIGNPSPNWGSVSTEFSWPVSIANATTFNLVASEVVLAGNTAGCLTSVSGSAPTYQVKVSGCSIYAGTVTISLNEGVGVDSAGNRSLAVGPSAAVTIENPFVVQFSRTSDVIAEGNSTNAQQFTVTLDRPAPVNLEVSYHVVTNYTTADNPLNYNLPLTGSFTIPAGQTSWQITYDWLGDITASKSKIIQISLDKKTVSTPIVIGKNQMMRRMINDEEFEKFTFVAASENHTCAITDTDYVKCWGMNSSGQLGDGTTVAKEIPTLVSGGASYAAVSVGNSHTCAITLSGELRCWGANTNGQLGRGASPGDTSVPGAVDDVETYQKVSAGYDHTCGITSAGYVKCWGNNGWGQLGDGTYSGSSSPKPISDASKYISISAGAFGLTCGVTELGVAKCWGSGLLGNGPYSTETTPTAVAGDTYTSIEVDSAVVCGITTAGILKCWGDNSFGLVGDGTTNNSRFTPTAVVGGDLYSSVNIMNYPGHAVCGITNLGYAKCWGQNLEGRLGDGTNQDRLIPTFVDDVISYSSIAVGGSHTCGVTTDGVLKCWGGEGYSLYDFSIRKQLVPRDIGDGENYQQAIPGGCALTTAGVVKCWGINDNDELAVGSTEDRNLPTTVRGPSLYKKIDSERSYYSNLKNHRCAITTNDKVKCWGNNSVGQLGVGDSIDRSIPVEVKDTETYIAVSVGGHHSCGITSSGVAKCWGGNGNGSLGNGTGGNGTGSNMIEPWPVLDSDRYISISAGRGRTCGVTTAGIAKCWGDYSGGLGIPPMWGDTIVPTAVVGGDTYTSVASGTYHTCGITTGGTVNCWGVMMGGSDPLAIVDSDTYVQITSGYDHSCGITTTGIAKCWGENSSGQLGNGTIINSSTTPVVVSGGDTWTSIAADFFSTCGVTTMGKTKCWGLGARGMLGFGDISKKYSPVPIFDVGN